MSSIQHFSRSHKTGGENKTTCTATDYCRAQCTIGFHNGAPYICHCARLQAPQYPREQEYHLHNVSIVLKKI